MQNAYATYRRAVDLNLSIYCTASKCPTETCTRTHACCFLFQVHTTYMWYELRLRNVRRTSGQLGPREWTNMITILVCVTSSCFAFAIRMAVPEIVWDRCSASTARTAQRASERSQMHKRTIISINNINLYLVGRYKMYVRGRLLRWLVAFARFDVLRRRVNTIHVATQSATHLYSHAHSK